MRLTPLLCLLILIGLGACRSDTDFTPPSPTQALTVIAPTLDVVGTLSSLPSSPSVESSRVILRSFLGAYNRHDVMGVLATLAETFVYGDCDFAARRMHVFETTEGLTTWLQAKFAQQDRFRVDEILIAPAEGSPANDSRNTAVSLLRTSTSLHASDQPRPSLFKIVLNAEGNRIQYVNMYGNVDCEAGR